MRLLFVPSGDVTTHNKIEHTHTLERCQEALRVWQSGHYDYMLLSGGIFRPRRVQSVSAAKLMANWVLSQSLQPRPHQLLLEEQSRDTYENAYLSIELLRKQKLLHHITGITIVSELHHARRLRTTLVQGYNLTNIDIHPTHSKLSWHALMLEWLYELLHAIDPIGNNILAQMNRRSRTFASP
jgi:hypothetical protein